MFYFLHGDVPRAVDKANQMIGAMLKKQPDASRFKLEGDSFSVSELQELMGGQGLFSNKYIIDLRRLLEDESVKSETLGLIKELADSPNVFIWVEGKVKAADLKKIEKHSAKVQSFESPKSREAASKPFFNIFSLGDAFGERNKKKLWTGYIDALNHFAVEEIHGTLFWQLKNMIITTKISSAADAGLKPFVFNKAKVFAKNYSQEELEKLSSELVSISHDSRRGKQDFKIALERFCLSL